MGQYGISTFYEVNQANDIFCTQNQGRQRTGFLLEV